MSPPPPESRRTSVPPELLAAIQQITGQLSQREVLVRLVVEARRFSGGAAAALGGYILPGQQWSEVLLVGVEEGPEPYEVSREARSAAYAVFRRLSSERRSLRLEPAPELEPIFRGLRLRSGAPVQALCAVPILRRAGMVGLIILVDSRAGAFEALDPEPIEVLATCATTAMANAVKFAASRRDQERLFLFSEATEEALWDWDLESGHLWWGGGIQNLLGGSGGPITPHVDWKLSRIHPADAPRVRSSLDEAVRSSQMAWREEYRFQRADGSWASVEDRGYFLRDVDAKAFRMVGALRDVSVLKAMRERLTTVAQNATLALLLMDERQHCSYLNPAAEKMTGFTLAELQGKPLHDFVHHTRPDGSHYPLEECPIDRALPQKNQERGEDVFVRRDGSFYPVAFTASPIIENGVAVGTVIEVKDITEEKRQASEQAFLVEATSVLSSSLDYKETLQRLVSLVVPRFADGCYVDILEGTDIVQMAIAHREPEAAERYRAMRLEQTLTLEGDNFVSKVIRTGTPAFVPELTPEVMEKMALNRSHLPALKSLGLRSLLCVPLSTHGGPMGALTVAMDRSERSLGERDMLLMVELARRASLAVSNARLYEEATTAIRVRDDFLSIASHELKTPLTPILLQLTMLERRLGELVQDERSQEWLKVRLAMLRRQGRRLNHLVEGLLDISRLVGGQLRIDRQPVDLGKLAAEVIATFAEQGDLARSGCEVRLEAEPGVVGHWDRLRLEQVLTNLLSNALKYGPGQPIDVTLSSRDGIATLTVRDRGRGIAPEDQARIFGRFERAASSRNYGGLGLGLFIVRQILEAMGGEIHVRSALGEGATFTVRLPLALPVELRQEEARG